MFACKSAKISGKWFPQARILSGVRLASKVNLPHARFVSQILKAEMTFESFTAAMPSTALVSMSGSNTAVNVRLASSALTPLEERKALFAYVTRKAALFVSNTRPSLEDQRNQRGFDALPHFGMSYCGCMLEIVFEYMKSLCLVVDDVHALCESGIIVHFFVLDNVQVP